MSDEALHDRRRFLRGALSMGAGALLARCVAPRQVVAKGRVRAGGRGLPGVAVTDGLSVARADGEGWFEIPSDARREFLSVTVPAGYGLSGSVRRLTDRPVVFDLEPAREPDGRHAFLVLADPQPSNVAQAAMFREMVPDMAATVRPLGVPAFAMVVGDVVGDAPDLYAAHAESVKGIGAPALHLAGNHDDARRMRRFGPERYSFDRGAVHYVVLDNVRRRIGGYEGRIGREQLSWLAADLACVERGRPVVLFAHIPLLGTLHERQGISPQPWNCTADRAALARLLEPYRTHFVSGHMHEHEHARAGAVREHVCAAVCGAWWNGPVNLDGTPNGYSVFEVSGESFRWHHKAAGSEERMRLYPRGPDGCVVANVWDWDEAWDVSWSEEGGAGGPMERFTGMDPLRERMTRERHATGHLFRARPSQGARRVRVEARDPWGMVHVAEVDPRQPRFAAS
ncbi:MAG TPA: calcineurin-like phosphoesterase family protein [Planctomycetota bacterium]|nr:calcineurin-like phosphoesterase family protein [Planctomycetota bacterium]